MNLRKTILRSSLTLLGLFWLTWGSAAFAAPLRVISVPADYPTLAQALSAAVQGDTVQVAPGVYPETGLHLPPGVTLLGSGWQSTVIDGQGTGAVLSAGPGSVVEGITIRGSGPDYFNAGVWVSQGAVTLRSVRLTGNNAGLWGWCFDPASCDVHVTLERSLVDANASNGVNGNEQAVFTLNSNTIARNGGAGAILNDSASRAENNAIVSNEGPGLVNEVQAAEAYNNLWGNGGEDGASRDRPGPNGISADPLFRDPAQGDYRLLAASPMIGAGSPSAGADIGALPFTPSGAAPGAPVVEQSGSDWKVSWQAASGATGYRLYYGDCTRAKTSVVDTGGATGYTIQGAPAAGVAFVAVSAAGPGGQESSASTRPGYLGPCPAAPDALEAGSFPGGQVRLQWVDMSSIEQGFRIQRATGGLAAGSYTLVAELPPGTTTYTDLTPVPGETYWYRVAAFNGEGASPFSNETFTASFTSAPNLDEQYLLVLINEARADPGKFGYPDIPPVPPLAYNPLLNYAARAHSQAILNSGFQIGHCDPLGRCPTERAQAVGFKGMVGENLIQGMTGPEWVESTNQAFLDSPGHRDNMLSPAFNEAGLGHSYDPAKGGSSYWKGQYTETFCGRSGVVVPYLPSGAVVPYTSNVTTEYTYIANYYHPGGKAPTEALVVIEGVAYSMALSSGAPANGTYRFSITLPPGVHEYHFSFSFPGGSARLPETGSYPIPDTGPLLFEHRIYAPLVVDP